MLPTSSSPYNSVGSPFLSGLLKSSTRGLKIKDIQCPEDGYSLDDLTNNLSDSPEVVAKDWIKGLLDHQQKREFALHTNETMPLLLQAKFHPLLVEVHSRPDVVVCTRNGIPRLVIEVESRRNYKYTIQETILCMISQFCILRCFDDSISSCVGFTFPTIGRKFCVTKVFVHYDRLVFRCGLQLLDKVDVIHEIKSALKQQLPQYNPAFYPYLIRLSRQELDLFGVGATQVKTKSSLLVHSCDRTTYWKYAPHCTPHFDNIRSLNLQHSLLPKMKKVVIGELYFCVYDGICPPLPREDARLRLSSFLPMLKEALDELHSNNIAHMDVHLGNICFKHDHSIQLIDLDRCLPASGEDRVCSESDMYEVPSI